MGNSVNLYQQVSLSVPSKPAVHLNKNLRDMQIELLPYMLGAIKGAHSGTLD